MSKEAERLTYASDALIRQFTIEGELTARNGTDLNSEIKKAKSNTLKAYNKLYSGLPPMQCRNIRMEVKFYIHYPTDTTKRRYAMGLDYRPTNRCNMTKMINILAYCLQGKAYDNVKQIVELSMSKVYARKTCVEVKITEILPESGVEFK